MASVGMAGASLNGLAISATNHCLTGCVIGEVTGMAIGTAAGWGDVPTMSLAILLAYLFGFALTSLPLIRAGLAAATIVTTALAADTISITIMEAVDNLFIAVIPGALEAGLDEALFWATLLGGFAVAYPFAFLANRHLIARGRGHAVVHAYHGHGGGAEDEDHEGSGGEEPGVSLWQIAGALATVAAVIGIVAVISSNRDHGDSEDEAHAATAAQVDDDFTAQMVAHHELAIEMAEIAEDRAERPELRELAAAITAAQMSEIAQLESIHERLFDGPIEGHEHGDLGLTHAEKGMEMDPAELENATPFDRAFIDAMVPHHEGAIAMARIELEEGENRELRQIAEAIIAAQTTEIAQMNRWREQWYGAPSGAAPQAEGHTQDAH
ncbi:MAG TPA: DUF305 domain-containing protein [Solirubrobacterales bacterium]|nr:DUF305 domain-containing protein [Solirubrobacterales bacterium]